MQCTAIHHGTIEVSIGDSYPLTIKTKLEISYLGYCAHKRIPLIFLSRSARHIFIVVAGARSEIIRNWSRWSTKNKKIIINVSWSNVAMRHDSLADRAAQFLFAVYHPLLDRSATREQSFEKNSSGYLKFKFSCKFAHSHTCLTIR